MLKENVFKIISPTSCTLPLMRLINSFLQVFSFMKWEIVDSNVLVNANIHRDTVWHLGLIFIEKRGQSLVLYNQGTWPQMYSRGHNKNIAYMTSL